MGTKVDKLTRAERVRHDEGWLSAGPTVVVTDLAVYGFDADGEMALRTLHPGATIEAVRDSIGWKIRLPSGEVPTTRPPR